jgi:excisionase family DNA binding protein
MGGPLYYSLEELAAIWRVHPRTVGREIQRGRLKAFRVGGLLRVRHADRVRYERSREAQPRKVTDGRQT